MNIRRGNLNSYINRKRFWVWIIFALAFIFIFSSSCYTLDTVSIVRYELSFADSILHGEFKNFYQKAYDMMQIYQPEHSPAYDLPMNFVLGIWGIPLYFIAKLKGYTDISGSFTCLLYGKSILLLATLVSTCLIYKICLALDIEKKRAEWVAFLFPTSLLTLSYTAIVGQTDILSIVLALAGVYAYIKGNYKQFLIWFIIAFPFKQYSFFIFLPLLLLREKNIIKIGLQVISIFAVTLICNLPIRNCHLANEFKVDFSQRVFSLFTGNSLPFVNGVSSTVLLWGLVCLFCYLYKFGSDKFKNRQVIVYAMFAAMAAIFVGFGAYCYWYLNMAPYVVILIGYNSNNTRKMVLFETVGMLALSIVNVIKSDWCFDVQNCKNMLLDRIFMGRGFRSTFTLHEILTRTNLSMYQSSLAAVYVICIFALLWLARPCNAIQEAQQEDLCKPALYRAVINCLVALIPAGLYIIGVT